MKNASGVWDFQRKAVFGEMHDCSFDGNGYNGAGIDCYIGSAWFLLEHTGPTSLKIILTEIPAVYGTAVASMILGIALLAYIKNEVMAAMLWAVIVYAIPRVLLMAGMVLLGQWGIEFLWDFAQLLPANLFQFGAKVNMSHCEVLWKTSQGMTKCVIVGIVGTVLAIVAGIVMLRKKEV